MSFEWPDTLCPANVDILPPHDTWGDNTSLSGKGQVVPVIRPPFRMTLEFGLLHGPKAIAYRALLSRFEGRANAVRISLFDVWYRATDVEIGGGSVSHSDGTAFSDGTLYLTDDLEAVTVTGVQGQRVITADFGSYGQLLQAGLYFGLGDNPYIAQEVSWEGSVATIRCSPTLRFAYDDEPLLLKPKMIAKLETDRTGRLNLRRGRHGGPTLDLVEHFETPLAALS